MDSIQSIQLYTEGMSSRFFLDDPKTRDAVVMHFVVIGEVSSRIPEDFKKENPQIPWSEMRGLRNRIAHDYFGVDYEIVWDIIQNNLASLAQQIREIGN
ncbi:MAG: DUF86 domain-containing protein [Saprospiraceae bacterium]|nr:DUF86 domain-containing protein [Saprospiraceae bacterium]